MNHEEYIVTTYPKMPGAAALSAIEVLDRRVSSSGHAWSKRLLHLTKSAASGLAQNPPRLTSEERERVTALVQIRLAWHGEDPALRAFLTSTTEPTTIARCVCDTHPDTCKAHEETMK